MLLELTHEQVAKFWPLISKAIDEALPPIVKRSLDTKEKILSEFYNDRLIALLAVEDEEYSPYALIVAKPMVEDITGTRTFLIYILYAYKKVPITLWEKGYEDMRKLLKGKYDKILGYTNREEAISLVKHLNGDASWRLIELEV